MRFIYGGTPHAPRRNAPTKGGTAYHEPTLWSTAEHQVGNHLSDEVTAPGLQLTQVDALTTQMGIILSELRHEVQVLVSIPNELDCLTPGDGAVSVSGWKGHRVVCCCTNHTTKRVRDPGGRGQRRCGLPLPVPADGGRWHPYHQPTDDPTQ